MFKKLHLFYRWGFSYLRKFRKKEGKKLILEELFTQYESGEICYN